MTIRGTLHYDVYYNTIRCICTSTNQITCTVHKKISTKLLKQHIIGTLYTPEYVRIWLSVRCGLLRTRDRMYIVYWLIQVPETEWSLSTFLAPNRCSSCRYTIGAESVYSSPSQYRQKWAYCSKKKIITTQRLLGHGPQD